MRRSLFHNSLVWAATILASAVILKNTDLFLPMLLVLLMGAVASDALLARSKHSDSDEAAKKDA